MAHFFKFTQLLYLRIAALEQSQPTFFDLPDDVFSKSLLVLNTLLLYMCLFYIIYDIKNICEVFIETHIISFCCGSYQHNLSCIFISLYISRPTVL